MAGHSKWNNIKRKKAVIDSQRAKIFSELSKNIRTAVKESGTGDPAQSPSLRLAVDKARAASMPNENIKRTIERGLGIGKGGHLEEVVYEGYGPHGVGFIVIAITDNKARTAAEMRTLFSKHGGSLGGPGSVMFLFKRTHTQYDVAIPLEITDSAAQSELSEFEDVLLSHDDVEEVFHSAIFPG